MRIPFRKVYAKLNDDKIQGFYHGINPILACQGTAFEESFLQFSVDNTGITLSNAFTINDVVYTFDIYYARNPWIFRLRNWGVDHCLSLRQSPKSNLAQLIFDFTPYRIPNWEEPPEGILSQSVEVFKHYRSWPKIDATMFLGEGMFATLGLFVKQDNWAGPEEKLKQLYNIFYKEPKEVTPNSDLIDLDLPAIAAAISDYVQNPQTQLDSLESIQHNLWTGTSQEIEDRLDVVKIALTNDRNIVKIKALKTFEIGGRVVGGVRVLEDFLQKEHAEDVELEAVKSICYLLYEAYNLNVKMNVLLKAFGTTNIAKIHVISNGKLTPEQYEILESTKYRSEASMWSIDDQERLRNLLEIISNRSNHSTIIKECNRGLKDYPTPT